MPADRLLGTLLRSLQTYADQQDTPRLLGTAASLLTTLTNPLNIQLLTAQLLLAPAIWDRPDGLHTCLRFVGLFHSAARAVLKHDREVRHGTAPPLMPGQPPVGGGLSTDDWVRAVVRGADERSQRWRHLMVLSGLLLASAAGIEEEAVLSNSLRSTLEGALVQATNLALVEARDGDELGAHCIAMVLNHVFPTLREAERAQFDYDRLLPVLLGTAFFSTEGFQSAYFLGAVDPDVREVKPRRFNWSAESHSYQQLQSIMRRPLVTNMGPLSRLIAHAVENVRDPWLIQTMMDDLAGFARALCLQWRQNKLSGIDSSEETLFLEEETVRITLPLLWRMLKAALFATMIILRSALGRMLNDGALAADSVAPVLAAHALHTLRHLYFITSRLGADSFSQYTFSYLTAMDILTQYPMQSDAFIKAIKPPTSGHIPPHPLDRTLDLYFLNTAEHFTLAISPSTAEDVIIAAANPYLGAGGSARLVPLFEAAHSVMLAVLVAPAAAPLAARLLPFYATALFAAFPQALSPRQFRLAFRTLLRVAAPPAPLAQQLPDLPAVLLEMLRSRALNAPATPLPSPVTTASTPSPPPPMVDAADPAFTPTEQSTLTLTLLDALPQLPAPLLDEWLPLAADATNRVDEAGGARAAVRRRFWEVLVGGEMDPERGQVAVAWWCSRGGRELVLFGEGSEEV
ncbi:uncharacterized protein K452DRAFT_246312, partial [Aplosporella prunicola CBS 121167]